MIKGKRSEQAASSEWNERRWHSDKPAVAAGKGVQRMIKEKGFVLSFDALVALLVFFALLLAASSYLGQVEFEAGSSLSLKRAAMDSITVLEKSGEVEKAINSDKVSGLRSFLNKLPYAICADLRIFPESDLTNPTYAVLRSGCKKNYLEVATAKRAVLVESSGNAAFYLAEIRAWYRVSG